MKITDHVKGTTTFTHFRDKQLWYLTDTDFEFPVPVEDTDGATFPAKEKSIFFMRWIRKWMSALETAA
jgi:hypothetical protein